MNNPEKDSIAPFKAENYGGCAFRDQELDLLALIRNSCLVQNLSGTRSFSEYIGH